MRTVFDFIQKFLNPFHCSFTTLMIPMPPQRVKALPDLPLEVWLEIFQFATYVHGSATLIPLDPFAPKRVSNNVMGTNTPVLAMRTKLALVLVCRSWRQAAMQTLYRHLVIRSPARADLILATLNNSRSDLIEVRQSATAGYGRWTKHVEIYTYTRGSRAIHFLQTIFHILQLCPNLCILSGIWTHNLPEEFLKAISRLNGPSLQGLYWNDEGTYHLPDSMLEFLGSFRTLRVLDLRNFSGSNMLHLERSKTCLPKPTLPYVQDLIISAQSRSLAAATALALPSLRNVTLKTLASFRPPADDLAAFLKVHGLSLTTVDLPSPSTDSEPDPDNSYLRRTATHVNPNIFLESGVCPNLDTLTFPCTSPLIEPHVHKSLRRIGLRGVKAEYLYPEKSFNTKQHLLSFTLDNYPNLEVVRTVGYLVEADTDPLVKDVFIWWVEKFEKRGIDFLDGEGVLWAYTDPIESEAEEVQRLEASATKLTCAE